MSGRFILGVFLAVVLVAAGCSSSGEGDSPPSSTTVGPAAVTTTVESTTPTTAVDPVELTIVEVEAFDYGFRGLPTEIVVGVPMTLVNTSLTEYHNLVAWHLEPDDVRSSEEIIEDFSILPLDAFVDEAKQSVPVVGELHAGPGERSKARLRLISTGRYVLVDLVPQGADPDTAAANENGGSPYKIEGGPPGYQHGMIAVLTVTMATLALDNPWNSIIEVTFDGETCSLSGPTSVPEGTAQAFVLTNGSDIDVRLYVGSLIIGTYDELVKRQDTTTEGGVDWDDKLLNWATPEPLSFVPEHLPDIDLAENQTLAIPRLMTYQVSLESNGESLVASGPDAVAYGQAVIAVLNDSLGPMLCGPLQVTATES